MWSERKQDNPTGSRTSPGQTGSPERGSSEGAGPVSSLAVIGKGMVIRGQITSKESMYVDGEVDGSFTLPDCRLTIGPNGRVDAKVKAREVEVMGNVSGDMEASKKITIRKGGRLVGDLRTPGIVIEEGAYYKGKIEILNSEEYPNLTNPEPPRESRLKAVAG